MKKICKNCEYYTPPDDGYEVERDMGECSSDKIVYREGLDKSIYPLDDKLEYWDYESYSAGFSVGENFGCIHFKQKTR